MNDLIASEWLKLRTVRSTYYLLGCGAALLVIGTVIAAVTRVVEWDGAAPAARAGIEPLGTGLGGGVIQILVLIWGSFGALSITSEYATGAIRPGLVAVPQRHSFLLAKATVIAGLGAATALTMIFTIYAITQAIAAHRPLGTPLSTALPELLGTAFTVTVVSLLGLGLGTILRSTAGAIVSLFVIVIVLPGAAELPDPWGQWLGSATIPGLASGLMGGGPPSLPPPVAFAGLIGWVVAAIGAGMYVLTRRDA